LPASIQRVVHGGQHLIDSDLAIVIRIGGFAVKEGGVAESDIHHCEDLSDGYLQVTVTVADTS
jgi:hypothetical protein